MINQSLFLSLLSVKERNDVIDPIFLFFASYFGFYVLSYESDR